MIAVVDYRKGNLKSVERGLAAAGAEVTVTQNADEIARADAVVLPGVGAFADAMATMRELGQDRAIRDAIGRGVPFLGICLGLHLMFEAGEEHAEEGAPTPGLCLIPGTVSRLPKTDAAGNAYKVPHVGWNTVEYVNLAREEGGSPWEVDGLFSHDDDSREGTGDAHKASSAAKRGLFERLSVPRPLSPEGLQEDASAFLTPGDVQPDLFDGIPAGTHFYFTHSYVAPASGATIATTTHSVTFPSAVQIGNAFGVQFHPEKSSDAGAQLLANFTRIAAARA